MATIKLAEALLRRKELQQKVDQVRTIKDRDLFELKFERKPAAEGIDDIKAAVPKLDLAQVTAEHDHYAKQLRLVDAAIQQTNWTATVDLAETVMQDWFDKHPNGQKSK
jgi:hypothetical protein